MLKVGSRVCVVGSSAFNSQVGTVKRIDKETVSLKYEVMLDHYNDIDRGTIPFSEKELLEVTSSLSIQTQNTTLPNDSKERKNIPLYSGPLKYFPAALVGVAKVCKIGNDKHNPGKPLQHSREKSSDHEDCIVRHLIDLLENGGRDENGIPQVDYIAWRALALAQVWHEKNDGAPIAPAAKEG